MEINFCIYSIRRSGRHIVEEFLREELGYSFCNCVIDDETITKECYKTHIHLKHETNYDFDFNRIKKCIFLYRKDLVEQVDAILRLLYYELQKKKYLDTREEHISCIIDSNMSYIDIISTLKKNETFFSLNNIVSDCINFHRHIDEYINNNNNNILCIDFDSLVYTPDVNLRNIAEFIGCNDKTRIKKAINNYLPSLKSYTKKKLSYNRYIEMSKIIKEDLKIDIYNMVVKKKKLLVVSHGGSATTAFMEFISKYIPTNCSKDLDGLKHTLPSKIEDLPSRIVYIYGDMYKTMRSLFRRKAGEITIASIHEYKLKGIKHSRDLPANFEDFEAYTKLVTLENREPVGCLVHMREWKKVPNVFFIHYEQICTSDTIDEYLGIPKGTCSQFTIEKRESQIQSYETPEYLEIMKGLDLRVQGIITGQPHKSNILIVSFPRSGFHLLQTIFESYFSIKECACQKNCDDVVNTCVKEDIAFHRDHDMNLKLNKIQFNKIIILYRKDIIEQLDAFFRYQFRNFEFDKQIQNTAIRHSACKELVIPYSEKLDFFRIVLKEYKDWLQKWVNEPTPNSIIIEYDKFMKNPQKTLDRIQEHVLETKDSELSAKIVEEMKIEYKHSLTPEKYKELANLLAQLN
jgi:hypothetical protein